jgi:vitamin B12 transporter
VALATDWEAGENPALPRNCKREVLTNHCAEAWEGRVRSRSSWAIPRKPGDRRERQQQPLSREKEDCVRLSRLLPIIFLISVAAFAADLHVRVIDPQSAVVPGARVAIFTTSNKTIAVAATGADGTATFNGIAEGNYRVQVLAAGFRERAVDASVPSEPLTVQVAVAGEAKTVVVTATATPVAVEESGSSISTLDSGQIRTVNQQELADVLRYLPGAYVSDAGQRGGLSTMFVRGGESRYNKVIVDGVPVNEAGGTFNFSAVPVSEFGRLEMLRGAESTLYGSDAMSSVVQVWSTSGATKTPLVTFGADGGTFGSARGYAAVSGARDRFDYNIYGEQFNTEGQGINDTYSDSMQGGNFGWKLNDRASLRFRIRHSNSRSGVPGGWLYSTGTIAPDSDQYARQNDTLANLDANVAFAHNWQNRFSVFEYNHVRLNSDNVVDANRPFDDPFSAISRFNRAGFDWQSELTERQWTRTVFGYHFEDENGFIDDAFVSFGFPGTSHTHGLRRNHAVYGEQLLNWRRVSLVLGGRFEHNESFGNRGVPRASITYAIARGGELFSGTRLRGTYSEGFKAPTFDESFGVTGSFPTNPNPNLLPERVRTLEAGVLQDFAGGRVSLAATYFNNLFRNQIQFTFDPVTFDGQYINVNKALAHGAEFEVHARLSKALNITSSYTYTSTQALNAPLCTPGTGCTADGEPLLRRPKHFGQVLATYVAGRWGGSVGGSFVGRRPDSDFLFGVIPPQTFVDGYARVDVSAWREITRNVTAYASVYNALNQRYQEVAGYPALKANFRAGLRFRFGGE